MGQGLGPQKAAEHGIQMCGSTGEGIIICPEQQTDLSFKISVVLGAGPDGKNQMARVEGRQAALIDPVLDQGAFFVEQRFEIGFKFGAHAGRPLQDFTCKKAAFAGKFLRHRQFAVHIAKDFFDGITGGVHFDQGIKPVFHQLAEQRHMDFFLAAEIIEDVGFAESSLCCDLVQCGPAIPVARENLERGVENDAAVALLDPAWFFRDALWR